MEVVSELEGLSERDGWAIDGIDVSDGFLRVLGGVDLAVGVAGVEEATQPCSAPVGDKFGSCCQEAPYSIPSGV